MKFNNYIKKYLILNKIQIFSILILILGTGLISNVYALNPSSEVIKMIPGQTFAPFNIQASNGTSYLKNLATGELIIPKNHKFCLDSGCVTYFISDAINISINPGLNWSSISKSGSHLNDIGSPISGYNFNSQPLSNVKLGTQIDLNGQTLNNGGHILTAPSNSGTLLTNNGTFSGTIMNPIFNGNLTVSKSPLPNTEIDAGSGISSPSYIMSVYGSTFFAKNGTTGKIDYSGNNATVVINNVMNNGIGPNGGKVVFKAGTYPIHIVVPKSRMQFVGESWRNTILTRDSINHRIFEIISPNYLNTINRTEISDMQILGVGTNGPADCIFTNSTEFLFINHIDMTSCTRNGIYLEQVWFSEIANSYFHNTVGNESMGFSPIRIVSGSFDSTNQLLIDHNLFERDSSTAIKATGLGGANTNYMITVRGNDFEEHTAHRVGCCSDIQPNTLINFSNTRFSVIDGNYMTGGNKSQIWIGSNSDGNKITLNHMVPDLADCCVTLNGITTKSKNTEIGYNSISSSSAGAINLTSSALNTVMMANILSPNSGPNFTGSTNNILACSGFCSMGTTSLEGSKSINGINGISIGNDGLFNDAISIVAGSGTIAKSGNILMQEFAAAPSVIGVRSNGALGSPSAPNAGNNLLQMLAESYTGAAYTGNIGTIKIQTSEATTSIHQGTQIIGSTTLNGTTTTTTKYNATAEGFTSAPINKTNDCTSADIAPGLYGLCTYKNGNGTFKFWYNNHGTITHIIPS